MKRFCSSLALLLALSAATSLAVTYTSGHVPAGGVNTTFSGNSIFSTGATYSFAGFNTSDYVNLYWGVNFVANVAQSDVASPGNMTFASYNPSTGIIAFTSTQSWTFIDGASNLPVTTPTQFLLQVQPDTGMNAGFLGSGFLIGESATKGALGITGNAGEPVYQITGGSPFQGTFEFLTWDGTPGGVGTGTDVGDFYAANNGGSNTSVINTSVDFEFWWSVQKTTAKTVQVGTCKTSLPSFNSIQAAVSAVPPGAVIQICPGTYPEQVTINAPVTLQGVASGPDQSVLLTVPGAGLSQNGTTPVSSFPVFAQILVQDAGPVNISGLTVDGNSGSCPGGASAGIVYLSSSAPSSGKVFNSAIRNVASGCGSPQGAAIYAENGSGSASTLTIQGNSVHSINGQGIGFGPNVSGAITGNTISQVSNGLSFQNAGPNAKATGNNISSTQTAVSLNSANTVTVQSNSLSNSSGNAISLNDSSGTGNNVTKNTINEANCGISKNNAGSDVFLPNTILNAAAATCP
jgi:hypothetical protein